MADRSLKFTLDFLAKTAGLKDSAELLERMGDELDDDASAGKKLAAAIDAAAGAIEDDLARVTATAERLGQAMGPELAAKVDPAATVVDLQRMGLTLNEIEADADSLAASMKRMDNVSVAAASKIGSEAERSRSVFANYVGNAAQEIPALQNAFGPLNMAIGQFGEYATEGNIKLKQFLATGAAIGGVAVLMRSIANESERVAAAKAWRKEQVDGFVQSLRKGEDVAAAFVDRLEEAGKVDVKVGGVLDELVGGNVTDDMARAGVTADAFAEAVIGGADGLQKLSDAMRAAGVNSEDSTNVMLAATEQQDNYNQALKTAAELEVVFGDSAQRAADKAAASHERVAAATERHQQHVDDLNDSIAELYETTIALADGHLDYAEITDRAEDAVASFNDTLGDNKSSLEDIDDAARGAAQAIVEQKKAEVELGGASLNSRQGIDSLIASLYATAIALDPSSPLRAYLIGYINDLNRIPRNISTTLSISGAGGGSGAAIGTRNGQTPDGERTQSVGSGRGVIGTLIVNPPPTANDPYAYGRQAAEAIQALFAQGTRYPWMAT